MIVSMFLFSKLQICNTKYRFTKPINVQYLGVSNLFSVSLIKNYEEPWKNGFIIVANLHV